jgi:hypothetical protein
VGRQFAGLIPWIMILVIPVGKQAMQKLVPFRQLTRVLAFLMIPAMVGPAMAGDGPVKIEEVEYRRWKHNIRLSNGDVELIATLDVGPRIICYKLKDGRNVFKEYDEQMGRSGEPEWMIRGGHRLWTAPEDTTRTYALDNTAVTYQKLSEGIRLVSLRDAQYGIRKEIEVTLAPQGSRVQLVHRVRNLGTQATELAPWALTVMAPGGTEIIPLPTKKPHPGSPKNARSAADFGPNQLWVLWPYTDLSDPRWKLGSQFVSLTQRPSSEPTKVGLVHRLGKVGYLNGKTLFIKSFEYHEGRRYPDGGVNYETFTNGDMLEMESLGPLQILEPGRSAEHTETWELHRVAPNEVMEDVLPRLRATPR